MPDPTIPAACENARKLARLCEYRDRFLRARLEPRPAGRDELQELLEARAVGLSYGELEQYDPESSFYDPDVGPYYWED